MIDIPSLVSSLVWLTFGVLGILTGNTYFYNMYTGLIITGLVQIVELCLLKDLIWYYIPMMHVFIHLMISFLNEGLKRRHPNGYKLWSKLIHLVCFSIYITYMIMPLIYIYMIVFGVMYIVCVYFTIKIFPLFGRHYATSRIILLRILVCTILSYVGIYAVNWNLHIPWLQNIIGQPVINVFMPYTIYLYIQLSTMIRSINLNRIVEVKSNKGIYIVYTVGRCPSYARI